MATTNKVSIESVLEQITATAPESVSVTWNFPGYISITSKDGAEICFGESLDDETGYSWNAMDFEGRETGCGYFEDLGTTEAIVTEFWSQTSKVSA
jgi:hypothetical protein